MDSNRTGIDAVRLATLQRDDLDTLLQGLSVGFDAMNVGVTMTDINGKIIYVNQVEATLHGRTVEELLGQDVGILAPAGKRRPLAIEQLKKMKAWKRESVNVRGDGSVFPVLLRSDVVMGFSGEPIAVVTTCEDIEALRETEDALRRSEAEHAALVENANYGICRVRMNGRFLTVNRAMVELLGYESQSELLDVNLGTEVFVDSEQYSELLDLCSDPGRAADMEASWNTKSGECLTVRVNGRAARNQHGEIESYELIVEDVTRRRELEAQLRQSQKLESLGQLTGGIAHDFNNILTVIQANIGLIAADLPEESVQLRDDLRESQKATRRGADLVKKLLAFSRREELSRKLVDLAQVVSGASKTLVRLLPENIEITVVAAEQVGTVFADPNAVEQILMNLATNARDAMPNGGRLYIETRRAWLDKEHRANFGWGHAGEYACIVVSDTGMGMDESTRQKLFEPFFTTKPAGQGTGLGMAMIHGLVKQHDGFVHVYSEIDNGTTVKVYLPHARSESIDTASSGYDFDDERVGRGTETILVVEDEAQIRRVAKRVLERKGYSVILAENGEVGLSQFRKYRDDIDLVLSDVIMPKLGGPGLYEAIRAEMGATQFMFMSGHAAHVLRVSGKLDPRLPFIYKPWTDTELIKRIRETLDRTPSAPKKGDANEVAL